MTQFTGGSDVAHTLIHGTNGNIKIEDAGFDWKILGPDGAQHSDAEVDYVAHMCDHDAFAYTGQKCSAMSIMFAHKSWIQKGL